MPTPASQSFDPDDWTFIDMGAFLTAYRAGQLPAMPSWQTVTGGAMRAGKKTAYARRFFVSHRWDSADDPDPTGWQLRALVQFASEAEANGPWPACFWYDFSCMPQHPRTAAETLVFRKGLDHLNQLSIACETINLVSGSSGIVTDFRRQLKRGWILCELIIAMRSGTWGWTFHQGDSEIIAASRRRTAEGDLRRELMEIGNRLPVESETALLEWFKANGVECQNGAELSMLARRIVEFSYDRHKREDLPRLAPDVVHTMTAGEVALYAIDAQGRSPNMPGYLCTWTHREDGRFDVRFTASPGD